MIKTPEIINGKVVSRWFSRGKARIPIFEDGTIGIDTYRTKGYEDKNKIGRETREQYRRYSNAFYQGHTKEYYKNIENKWAERGSNAKDTKEYNMARSQRDAWRENRLKAEKQEEDFNKLYDNPVEDKNVSKMIDYNAKTRVERYRNYNTEYNKEQDDYETKVYGSDVRKADARMKEVFGEDFKYAEEIEEEYQLYKKAKLDPDSIDAMTENSTDWEALNKKYASRYNEEIENKTRKKAITVDQESELESTKRMINDIKNQKIDRINTKAEMQFNKEAQRILQKPTVADVRKKLRNMENWNEEVQYGNMVITKTGHTGYHIRNVNDESDPMTDYFAGVYGVKEKQILNMLQERGIIEKAETKVNIKNTKQQRKKNNVVPTKRELASKIVDNQIRRGFVKKENREMQIQYRLRTMNKDELEKASKFYD